MILILVSCLVLTCIPVFLLSYFFGKPKETTRHDKDFQLWAFGDKISPKTSMSDILLLWNKKHPEYHFTPEDSVRESIEKMIQLYDHYTHQKHLV